MNIFDLPGPEFLLFYVVSLASALVLCWLIQRALRWPADMPSLAGREASPYDAAYLRAGRRGILQAAAMALQCRALIRASSTRRHLSRAHPLENPAGNLAPAERWLYRQISDTGVSVDAFYRLPLPTAEVVSDAFRDDLVMSENRMWTVRAAATSPLLLLALIGIIKMMVGISRDRPVGLLIVLLLVTVVLFAVCLHRVPQRTVRGSRVFHELKNRHSAMRYCGARHSGDVSPQEAALAVALFGVGSFSSGDLAALANTLQPPTVHLNASNGCGGSSCGGGGCGGGGGGGGGGGCGGCGGH